MATRTPMNSPTRIALELLIKNDSDVNPKPVRVSTRRTRIDGRGKGKTLWVNLTTAKALERRGLAVVKTSLDGGLILDITLDGVTYQF